MLFDAEVPVQFAFDAEQAHTFDVLIIPWQILYDHKLEAALLDYISQGGRLMTTPDLLVRNEDNVYFTEVPAFYTEVFGKERYFEDSKEIGEPLIAQQTYGKGEVIVIKR